MTPTPVPIDPHLDRLFVRYWENTLSSDEAADLNSRLTVDPAARQWFRWFCTQAAFTAEWAAVHPVPRTGSSDAPGSARRLLSRRRALVGLGGLAAGFAGLLLYRRSEADTDALQSFTLMSARGHVSTVGMTIQELTIGKIIPTGETVATSGTNSHAVLGRGDGSVVTVSADSRVTVADTTDRLTLHHGALSVAVPALALSRSALKLVTPLAIVSSEGGAVVALCTEESGTEIQVQHGRVYVCNSRGVALTDVVGGELLTIRGDGEHTKERLVRTPDTFSLDLTQPLPEGWHVGRREETAQCPVLVPEWWYDPYHSAVLNQIRSHKPWTRGLVSVHSDSVISIRYRADRAARGQVCLCVRTERTGKATTGVLEWNSRYEACRPGEWKTITVRGREMLDCKEAPTFPEPWVGFLLIFNTYDADIGLRVADFRVSRPGDPADG